MDSEKHIAIQLASIVPVNPTSKKEIKLRRRRSIIREFGLNTSTHGIPGIARSESIPNRIFWSIAFIAFTGVMLYFIVEAIIAFYQYPTQTSVSFVSERSQYFPAFTFCNTGGTRFDALMNAYKNYLNASNMTNINLTDTVMLTFMKNLLPNLINTGQSIDPYVFSLDATMMSCTYASLPCSANDFTSFYSASYGRCYTFNAKTSSNSLYYSYSNSGVGVLTLRLYLYNHLFVTLISEGMSMIGMIHDNKQLPLIERVGMTLAPGFKHRLTYTKKTVYTLPSPYSTCRSTIPLDMESMFDNYGGANYEYSEDICYILCQQAYIYTRCGCVSPVQWNARSIILPGTNKVIFAPICNGTDVCFGTATIEFETSTSIIETYCTECSQQCLMTTFSVKSSLSTTPPNWLMSSIKNFVENSSIPLPTNWSTEWREYVKASYLSLEILGESTLVENYTDTATMGFVDVLSNIGGQTGLWIGISFLSLMELVEMLYRLIRYHFYLVKRAAERKKLGISPEQ